MRKSIYISRKVLNTDDIRAWARSQGFLSCIKESELHVTLAFDHKKHDWRDLPLETEETIHVLHPNERGVELFKNGAVVLEIYSAELTSRWAELVQAGLHWKYPDYRPHVTLTYTIPENFDLSKVVPFDGVLKFGPEVATEVVWHARSILSEEEL